MWRTIFAPLGDGILDARTDATLGYVLTRPSTGNDVSVGSGTSVVAGFGHRCTGPEPLTIPSVTGTARTDVITVRYDPAFTIPNPDTSPGAPATVSVPCRLFRVAGTPGAGNPALAVGPTGPQDFPLYRITRTAGAALNAAGTTVVDLRQYSRQGSGVVTPDTGLAGTPTAPLQVIPGRRTVSTDVAGRASILFPTPFPTALHCVAGLTVELASAGWASLLPGSLSRTGFTVLLRSSTGAPLSSVTSTFSYVAYGF